MLAVSSAVFSTTEYSTIFTSFYSPLSQVVPDVVDLVQSLRTDGLPTSKAFLLQFTELIHCMMYQYSGFPDLYDNILEAIKVTECGGNLFPWWDLNILARESFCDTLGLCFISSDRPK